MKTCRKWFKSTLIRYCKSGKSNEAEYRKVYWKIVEKKFERKKKISKQFYNKNSSITENWEDF